VTFAALALSQEAGGVRVGLGADSILIANAALANITQTDFLFAGG
jgi:hypothetical protein